MSERRQVQVLVALAIVFVLSLMVFMISLNAQQARTQATIDSNSARRDSQMVVLQQTMVQLLQAQGDTTATNRAIACILGIDPDDRSDASVAECFHQEGLPAP